ncbi:MarR family winged helix-turn-helix transcriptional regulator [Kutzneria sp. 744]|uniref:MarR family winged helix-turn-helix transcriptional regulator n=1 Tax=Kutzneria sp. (strain 744) TaxID=345341 RepID=UPI0003EEC8AB|nr:MarR family winged helix-turn-helix transcriptional regulator [Kutzneria sp. 744]EWM09823.1 MarR-family transcriptional regulator [Kutzneria sp. 744]
MSQAANSELRPGYLVKRVQQLVRHAADADLRNTGLSVSQYAVLNALAEHPGASSAELARQCFVTRQSLQDVLSGLRANGLVVVAEKAVTGRARPAGLTDLGRRRLTEAERVMTAVEEQMLTGLSAEDRSRLTNLLIRCAENLTDLS